ncbi:MAG: hypothetical protein HOP37_09460 [Cyclobacteriaceae bacterium]|nr:hypothetical protein [Cyclobacteriaceae bacterium]
MSESELAAPLVAWLQDQNWDVYQEVQFRQRGGVADIVAVRNGIVWIIETKTSYSFKVLDQASSWPVHFRSVAVPKTFSDKRDYRVARFYYLVGVIEISSGGRIEEIVRPPVFTKNKKAVNDYKQQLTELHKTFASAGSKSGHHLTPYKQTILEVRRVIDENPGCTIKFLYQMLGSMHYANGPSFRGNLLKALCTFENDWCRVDHSGKSAKFYIRNNK